MYVRANQSEVFVSYSFERRGMSCERSDGSVLLVSTGLGYLRVVGRLKPFLAVYRWDCGGVVSGEGGGPRGGN